MSAATARPTALQRRSRLTRDRILTAATPLFLRDGYVPTTMGSIAAEAGVAVQSLYLGFGSKLGILKAAVDVAIVGDDEAPALLDRAWVGELEEAGDGPQAVGLFVAQVRCICERVHPLYAVVQAGADGEAGQLLASIKRARREGIGAIAQLLARKPGFSPGLTVETAADVIYGLAGEDHYSLLVVDCGWTPAAWEAWCADTLIGLLFPSR